jgi:parallel beta-helix repeat protein
MALNKLIMKKLLMVFMVMLHISVFAKQYYVSNTGNDNNDGLTPQTAWKTIAKVNSKMNIFVAGDIISFNGGDEFYGTLTVSNINGNSGNPIIFTSYGSGKAAIKSSKAITDWVKSSGNTWVASETNDIGQVFKNNIPLKNASSDRLNLYTIKSNSSQTVFTSTDLIGSSNIVGSTVFLKTRQYAYYPRVVKAFNSGTGQVTIDSAPNQSLSSGNEFFVINGLSLLSSQDDWYYDNIANKLYIYSISSPTNIVATLGDTKGIKITSSSNLNIDGLAIKEVNNNGIEVVGSTNINVINNQLDYTYEYGIFISGGSNNSIRNNVVNYVNHRGIVSESDNNTIEGNTVTDVALINNLTYWGIWNPIGIRATKRNVIIRNNVVLNMGYNGITFTGQNSIIENNYIKDFCKTIVDGGGIYTFNPSFTNPIATGSIVRNNVIIQSKGINEGETIIGIYLDDRTHDVSILNNSLSGAKRGIFLHNTKRVTVRGNNTYNSVESGLAFGEDSAGGDGQTVDNVITNNHFFVEENLYGSSSISLFSLYNNYDFGTFDNNKYYNIGNYAKVLIRNKTINFMNSQFPKEFELSDWQSLSGEDASTTLNTNYFDTFTVASTINTKFTEDFASGISGWKKSSGVISDGGGYLKFKPSSNTSLTYNNNLRFSVTTGDIILVEFDYKTNIDHDGRINISMTGSPYSGLGNRSFLATTTWRTYKQYYTSTFTGNNVRLDIYSNHATAELDIDNIRITQITLGTKPINSFFAYNKEKTSQSIAIPAGIWEDSDGKKYSGGVVLSPFTSKILILSNGSVSANAGADLSICTGESTTLTASGGSTYSWSTGETTASITITPTTTTTYTVTVGDGAGNSSTDSVIVTVNSVTANAGADVSIIDGDSTTLTASGGDSYLWSSGETTASITVSPNVTTTYTATVTQNGCNDTDTVQVTVTSPPPSTVVANAGADVTICNADNTTLTASGGSTYLWSTGETTASITVSPTTTTTYSVTVGDGAGNSDTDSVIVTVNTVTANAGADVTITNGDSITLTASGGDTYLWSTGETTASITVSPNVTTTYTATVTINGCSDADTVQVTVTSPSTVVANAGADVTICNGDSTTLTASGGSLYQWSTGETTQSITVSPTATQTFSVTVSEEGSNSASDDVIVTVNDVPVASAGSDKTIDLGDSITLTASGGDTYLWSTGETTASIKVSPETSTVYSVTVFKNTCQDTASVQVTVNQVDITNPPPAKADAGQDVTICIGESVNLTASGGATYLWSTGEAQKSINVKPTRTTTYSLEATRGGITDTDTVTITVENCSALFNDQNSSMVIYPNPTKGNLNVSINNINENFNIFITDSKGSVIYMDKLDVNQDKYSKEIDLSKYAKGIYFVRLFNSDQNLVKKIVII